MKKETEFKFKLVGFIGVIALLGAVVGYFSYDLTHPAPVLQDFLVGDDTCMVYNPSAPQLTVGSPVSLEDCYAGEFTSKQIDGFRFTKKVNVVVLGGSDAFQ